MAALRTSTHSHTRALLCYILNLQAGAEFFEGRSFKTGQAAPALIGMLADPDPDVCDAAIDALGHISDPTAGPALLEAYLKERDDVGVCVLLASALGLCRYAQAIPTLIEALSSPNGVLRRQGNLGTQASPSPGGKRTPTESTDARD